MAVSIKSSLTFNPAGVEGIVATGDKRFKEAFKYASGCRELSIDEVNEALERYNGLDCREQQAFYVYAVEYGRGLERALDDAESDPYVVEWVDDYEDNYEGFMLYLVDCGLWCEELRDCSEGRNWFNPSNYIDWERAGRDLFLNGDYSQVTDPESGEVLYYSNFY